MIDWTSIVLALIGVATGGGITGLIFYRINKAGAKADVLDKLMEVANQYATSLQNQQETFHNVIQMKNEGMKMRDDLIKTYDQRLLDNEQIIRESNRERKQLEYTVKDLGRQVEGLQKQVNKEMSERKYAERYICFVEECKDREPILGTYKSGDRFRPKIKKAQ